MTCNIISTILFISSSAILISTEENRQFRTIDTTGGPVKGYLSDGVYTFYGIPYAAAPKGISKFKDPLPGPTWSETFDASDKSIACPQPLMPEGSNLLPNFTLNITEDCLVANLFLPVGLDNSLPVVVSIHGGAYSLGLGNTVTPFSLVKEGNIIFVSANYRLSIYGFLCLGTEDAPGNAGLKDVIALLKWVKENIADFGGNPDDVTLTGFSAGSSMITLLMGIEAVDGLYSKVILESGSPLSSWGFASDPTESAVAFAHAEGLTDVDKLQEFYSNLGQDKLRIDNMGTDDGALYFVPCRERKREEAVVTDSPYSLLKSGALKKTPVLISSNEMEGLFRIAFFDAWSARMDENFAQFLPADLRFGSEQEKEFVANKVKEFYFGNGTVASNMRGYIDFLTDSVFGYSVQKTARELVNNGNQDVYLYHFTYHEPNERGANHCDQTRAIYDETPFTTDESNLSPSRKQVKNVIRQFWLDFVKNGKPLLNPTEDYKEGWPALSKTQLPYMEISSHPHIKHDLLKERLEFWDKIYESHRRLPIPPLSDLHSEL